MTRARAAWEALSPFGQRAALWLLVVGSSLAVVAYARCTAPRSATPAPVVQPVPLAALLSATGGGELAEWERYVRSSAQPLPLAPEAGSSTAVEASVRGSAGASSTAFEHSTREEEGRDGAPVERTVTPQRELTPTGTPVPSLPSPALTEAEVYAAALAASGSERWARQATVVSWCESRYRTDAVGAAGERGAWQVLPRFHGPVPGDIEGQAAQAYRLWETAGWSPWTCSMGETR